MVLFLSYTDNCTVICQMYICHNTLQTFWKKFAPNINKSSAKIKPNLNATAGNSHFLEMILWNVDWKANCIGITCRVYINLQYFAIKN